MDFIVEVSARHVHLTQEHVEALFGKGHELTFDRPLSQPGQFLSKEKVTIKNGDRKIERVSILGPVRKASQVEVSKTDSVALRAEGFIRESGDLAGTAPVEIEGARGKHSAFGRPYHCKTPYSHDSRECGGSGSQR